MSLAQADLPRDPGALRAFAAALQAEMRCEIAARDAEIYAKTLHIEKLKAQLAVLRRARFGRSSEKLDAEIEQLELLIGDLEENKAEKQARTAKRGKLRRPAPVSWPAARGDAKSPAASLCLIIFHARLSSMNQPVPVHPVAARCSARSARMSGRCWNMCPPFSSGWSTSGRR